MILLGWNARSLACQFAFVWMICPSPAAMCDSDTYASEWEYNMSSSSTIEKQKAEGQGADTRPKKPSPQSSEQDAQKHNVSLPVDPPKVS